MLMKVYVLNYKTCLQRASQLFLWESHVSTKYLAEVVVLVREINSNQIEGL